MKCSTKYKNPRASSNEEYVIIFYCSWSNLKDHILSVGQMIGEKLNYHERRMYYKTDIQTWKGTRATGCEKNHTYVLGKSVFKDKWVELDSY
jgi:hypothetical protein